MEYPITENKQEILRIARQMITDNPVRYPQTMLSNFIQTYQEFLPDEQQLTELFLGAIYHQQLYGTSIIEYFMYNFQHRTHVQKTEYITWFNRYIYMAFLNKQKDLHLLDNKFEAYTLLKPFYKREAMLLSGEDDYTAFCEFVAQHPSVFVKPVNMDLAEGVHRLTVDTHADLKVLFRALLKEADNLSGEEVTRVIDHRLILEEEIIPSPAIAQFNPHEMSLVRVTTILVKHRVYFFYPVFRLMCGNGVDQTGEQYSLEALIDAQTGEVVTDGIESRWTKPYHPVSGLKIKGFQLPQWQELLHMLDTAARMLPTLRYIGWDVAHTDRGWCIVEGNTNGELCMSQMCLGHGVKQELENLINFHIPYNFMLEQVEKSIENIKHKTTDALISQPTS